MVGAGLGLGGSAAVTTWITRTDPKESGAGRMHVARLMTNPNAGAVAGAILGAVLGHRAASGLPALQSLAVRVASIGGGATLAAAGLADRLVNHDAYERGEARATRGIEEAHASFAALGLDAGEPPEVEYERLYPNAGYLPGPDEFIIGTSHRSGKSFATSQEVLDH